MEQRIGIERMEEAVNLFGSFDENIRLLEAEFQVQAVNRGGEIVISGEPENVMLAEKAVQALLTLAQLFALLIGAVSMLCAAAQALGRAFARIQPLSLWLCALGALGLLLAARVLHFMFLQGLLHLCLPLVPRQAAVFTSLAPQVVVMKRTAWDTALAIAFFLCAALYQLYKTC